ncbi:MAG: hypothetical protein OEW84_07730, partial [Aigarchaeota archaeon]|nr:hypothetical protein [Aigarchaeota archaeon]
CGKCLLLGEASSYAEIFVLKAIRRGLDTREKVFGSAGKGVSLDVIDGCIESALERGLIMQRSPFNPGRPERFILTARGFEMAQRIESRPLPVNPTQSSSLRERSVNKALGAALLGIGFLVLYTGVALAMGFVNQPAPEMQTADIGPVTSSEELQTAIVDSVLSALRPLFWASVQLGATALLVLAGGLVMARGVTLFKS